MKYAVRAIVVAALTLSAGNAPASAGATPTALELASASFAKIDDYRTTVVVHETDGRRVEDRTYNVLFKKPSLERVDVLAGPGKGGGIVWLGGDKVIGHHGGLLSGIRLSFGLHDSQVRTLRGDSVDTATIPSMLGDFHAVKGEISEAPGPPMGGGGSMAITLNVADAAAFNGVTREVLYLSTATNMPMRRERFVGALLVKSENVTEMTTNLGLTAADFPW